MGISKGFSGYFSLFLGTALLFAFVVVAGTLMPTPLALGDAPIELS
jgi:hypothetical protein